jgi:hypothetical protein
VHFLQLPSSLFRLLSSLFVFSCILPYSAAARRYLTLPSSVLFLATEKGRLKVAPWDGYLKYYNLAEKVG